MDQELVNSLRDKDERRIISALEKFLCENEKTFSFPHLEQMTVRKNLWDLLVSTLKDSALSGTHTLCLQSIRILSRDRKDLNEIVDQHVIETLLHHAKLDRGNRHLENLNRECVLEAQKCLFNLIFNSMKAQQLAADSQLAEGIVSRLEHFNNPQLTHSIKFFDLRILAVLLSLSAPSRSRVRFLLNGIPRLAKFLRSVDTTRLSEEEIDLCQEALTAIFPLLLPMEPPKVAEVPELDDSPEAWEDSSEIDLKLLHVIRPLLLAEIQSPVKREELQSKVINLLNNINPQNYIGLVPDGDFAAVDSVLDFLSSRLDKTNVNQVEMLMPVLNFLREACMTNGFIRRYVRFHVLPPLRDASQRPEVGTSLRNKLCRLMTASNGEVASMVAEFLFVLCKENTARLIKYTGFGNAAGLLANRGLMGGQRQTRNPNYSSDSDDSDTEEYEQVRDKVNPVLGCTEAPHADPMEGMSEDQKEYEAVKLVNLMDRLHRMGIVQPAAVGEDGKPHPVEHILQLQDSLPKNYAIHDEEESDGEVN